MVEVTPEEGKSALKTALECAYELLLQKIISNPNDMMGILLLGTVILTTFRTLNDTGENKSGRKLSTFIHSHGLRCPRCSRDQGVEASFKWYSRP